jgi:hypothetical protein
LNGRILRTLIVLLIGVGVFGLLRFGAAQPPAIPGPGASALVSGAPPLQSLIQDQGNTVSLPGGRTLWIFADTANLTAQPRFFVTSSAGVAVGRSLRLDYLTNKSGTPIEFLPRTPAERAGQVPGVSYTAIWPTGATALPDGRIVIAYAKYQVRMKPKVDFVFLAGGLFTYRFDDADLSKPANRFADDLWTPADGPIASPVYWHGFVYFTRCEHFRCYSARSTPALMADRTSYRWWTGTDWSADVAARVPMVIGSDVPGQNPSIAYSPTLNLFTMTDTSGGIQSGRGLLWVARDPWGPWSRSASFPMPQCPSGGCYTLNVHPEQSAPGSLRISFATNGVGPYVRVIDVPVRVDDAGLIPGISTHTMTTCPNPQPPALSPAACSASPRTPTTSTSAPPAP